MSCGQPSGIARAYASINTVARSVSRLLERIQKPWESVRSISIMRSLEMSESWAHILFEK